MIAASRASVSSNVQLSREAFCCISSAEVATPPAFAALAGPNRIPASWNRRMASGVLGMLAPSATAMTPLSTRLFASLPVNRSEEHTSELQSLMRISYAVFCLKKKNNKNSTEYYIEQDLY